MEKVVDLSGGGLDLDYRVGQPRRAEDLLDHLLGVLVLVGSGRGGDIDDLVDALLELAEVEGPVVQCGGQAEAILDQDFLARPVAAVHRAHLRQRHVRLIDEQQEVFGEVVEEGVGSASRLALGEMPRVVLDPGAVPRLPHHLDVVVRPGLQPLGLEELAGVLEEEQLILQLGLDVVNRLLELLLRGHEVLCGVYLDLVALCQKLASQGIDLYNPVDLISPELDADADLVLIGRQDLNGVALGAETPPTEVEVVAVVLHVHKLAHESLPAAYLAPSDGCDEVLVLLRRAEAEDARYRCDDEHVPPSQQPACGGVTELVELFVYVGVLLNVGVGAGNVGFRLVVVVVADEVLDGRCWERTP